jgi:AAHS family 4-hydroxybenzoate transporter-like MFS transporter
LSSTTALAVAAFLAGAVVLGIQSGINLVGAMIYPTSLRANGSGWQPGLGRFGAIVGRFAGTLLVGLPIEKMYLWATVSFALGAVVTFIVHLLNTARLRAYPELAKAQ